MAKQHNTPEMSSKQHDTPEMPSTQVAAGAHHVCSMHGPPRANCYKIFLGLPGTLQGSGIPL